MTKETRNEDLVPPGFSRRRLQNFFTIGFLYAAYYMCRFNLLSVANKRLSTEFGWHPDEWGIIVNAVLWAYAVGQLINGLRVDRIGGKKMILYGALGIAVVNVLFGAGLFIRTFSYFVVLGAFLGFFQSHGNPSIIKVNGTWFRANERGTFAGLFGFIIQVGRWAILVAGGYLAAWAPWPWLFYAPTVVLAFAAWLTYRNLAETPESLGYPAVDLEDPEHDDRTLTTKDAREIIRSVVRQKELWIVSAAYFCTGVIRWGVDVWYIRYLQEVYGIATDSFGYQITAFLIPIAAVSGSLAAGFLSDKLFGARRGPAAAIMYAGSFVTLLLFFYFPGPIVCVVLLIVVQIFINGPHSLLGGAATRDYGGRKATGFASGLVDSFQYFGGGLFAGSIIGGLMERYGTIPGSTNISATGWQMWIGVLIGFSLLGAILMAWMWNMKPRKFPLSHKS